MMIRATKPVDRGMGWVGLVATLIVAMAVQGCAGGVRAQKSSGSPARFGADIGVSLPVGEGGGGGRGR